MAERTLGSQFKHLVLALINATLILVALCLWLAWGTLSAADRFSERLTSTAEMVLPVRDDLQALTTELAETNALLTARREAGTGAGRGPDLAALEARMAGLETRLTELTAAVSEMGTDPEALVETAVQTAFRETGALVTGWRAGRNQNGEAE